MRHRSARWTDHGGDIHLCRSYQRLITTDGITAITCFATSTAGNVSVAQPQIVRLDKTAPIITGSRSPAANAFGWNNSPVTASFTASDAISAVFSVSPPTTLTANAADLSVTGSAMDMAGNVASAVDARDASGRRAVLPAAPRWALEP
jgi:hypothetical protein